MARIQDKMPNPIKPRGPAALELLERGGGGRHKNKQDFERGHARQPKHKGRPQEEGMVDLTKTASSADSLRDSLNDWWGDVYAELVAECVLVNWDATILSRDPKFMRVRISIESPFEKGVILRGPKAPHVQALLNLSNVDQLDVTLFLGKSTNSFSVNPLEVVSTAIAARVYDRARELVLRNELYPD